MEQSISIMVDRITSILKDADPSIFLYGSVARNDFKLGWSDIDIICLTRNAIQDNQVSELVCLRQALQSECPANPYFRLFEGGMLTLDAFLHNKEDTVVYWGTSGQRVTSSYSLCPFGKMELRENSRLLYGNDFRPLVPCPTRPEIIEAIKSHYKTIRQHGKSNAGFLLDTARCLYTLKTNKIIAKTKAGEWALKENICPDASVMIKAIEIRKSPQELLNTASTIKWQSNLESHIQKFADALEAELQAH